MDSILIRSPWPPAMVHDRPLHASFNSSPRYVDDMGCEFPFCSIDNDELGLLLRQDGKVLQHQQSASSRVGSNRKFGVQYLVFYFIYSLLLHCKNGL